MRQINEIRRKIRLAKVFSLQRPNSQAESQPTKTKCPTQNPRPKNPHQGSLKTHRLEEETTTESSKNNNRHPIIQTAVPFNSPPLPLSPPTLLAAPPPKTPTETATDLPTAIHNCSQLHCLINGSDY